MSELSNMHPRGDAAPLRRIARELSDDMHKLEPHDAEALVTEVAARLQPVRGDLSDADFVELVRDVVRTKLRFSELDTAEFEAPIPTPPPDLTRRAD